MRKILVVAAHPDDELLGEAGTIRRFVDEGVEAHALILAEGLTSRAATRDECDMGELKSLRSDASAAAEVVGYSTIDFCGFPDNRMDSVDLLDVIKTVSKFIEKYEPDTIFTHHHGDLNVDHRITCDAVLTACRPVGEYTVKRIYAFETPSSSEWNYNYTDPFKPNVFVDVSKTIAAKIEGMTKYRSESASEPHPRSPDKLLALAGYRGSNVGVKYAEAFQLLREVW
ncbi:GlcNAc-PI de-N-acetylase [Paraeggerthella hongkongensis]|uniref:PIG-L deacetylase family protein n=1 Tax=Paraeggerthella sp. TaxID=2897350 RepID=UPI000DF79162|nr:GlcNAc-PI de-N-acetylase [Paraeggerthella hongkongensis]